MAVIAIDLGTTTCKAAVFDGPRMSGLARRHYSYTSLQDGWAEQDAEAVWALVQSVVREALAAAGKTSRIRAICVSVQGDAIIPIDAGGRALHPAILGMDTRSHQESADLQSHFGRGQLYGVSGMPCEPLNAITKVWWLMRNRPGLGRRLWKFTHYEDFLLMKIAGVPGLDYTMASRTMAFDPVRKEWIAPVLEHVGVSASQLGNVSAPGVPVGIILPLVAAQWGLDKTVLVVTGGHDQCMAAVGAGVIEPDMACYSMGTAEVISACFDLPRMNAPMLEHNYPCYASAVNGQYFTITLNQSGGLSLEWFQEAMAGLDSGSDGQEPIAPSQLEGLSISPSPVLFLPHLVGSGTPTCDRLSRGSFLGLSLKTGGREMFQAVADAMAFEARLNLEALENLQIPVTGLRAVGGGTKSHTLMELKATVLNRPIWLFENPEAALLGAAMMAQVALGEFRNLLAARAECVKTRQIVEPRRSAVDAYSSAFERYRQVYGTLRSFYQNWSVECAMPALV